MRRFVTPYRCLVLAMAAVAPALAAADVIHLKNGDVIYADQVIDAGYRVQYQIADDTYVIPKSLVQTIDQTTQKTSSQAPFGGTTSLALPAYAPATHVNGEGLVLDQVVRNGEINREALNAIDSRGNGTETTIAFYVAARQEFQTGDYSTARRDFETALRNDPQNPAVLNFYAALLVKMGDPRQALVYARRAALQAPDSADAFAVLGYTQFADDRVKDAIQSWKKSLALRPDNSIEQLLARAERELSAESNYAEHETGHFVLRYEGAQSSEAFRTQILTSLESDYKDLAREFGSEPPSSIQVVLYTSQTFFDVTRAPAWMGALNDGKIRIPLRGLDALNPDLVRILRHELAHSFVNHLSLGRCPQWLNEGIAQMLEPRGVGSSGPQLAQLFRQERETSLNTLETGFSVLSGADAALAYDESLATVQYIRDRYGMSDVLRILERLGHGESVESALRSTIHCDYRQLQDETGAALLREFAN